MTIGQLFLCKEWVHWRSIPSRRLWQSTKTGRRWGRCIIYRHPVLSRFLALPLWNSSRQVDHKGWKVLNKLVEQIQLHYLL